MAAGNDLRAARPRLALAAAAAHRAPFSRHDRAAEEVRVDTGIEGIWPMYGWAIAVALAIVAGIWSATNHREVRRSLVPEHVAGAALLGFFGWETLLGLPSAVSGYQILSAGLDDVPELRGQLAFLIAQAAFAIGAAVAVIGIVRRRTWGTVLGIGLALSIVVASVLQLAHITATFADSMTADAYWSVVVVSIVGLRAIPALAAVALLIWPFMRPSMRGVDGAGDEVPDASAQVSPSR
jgi:hypothetical protein